MGYGRPRIRANGSADPPREKWMAEKLKKAKTCQKSSFLNRGGVEVKAGVENGAMLTTYLFRYTSECTIS